MNKNLSLIFAGLMSAQLMADTYYDSTSPQSRTEYYQTTPNRGEYNRDGNYDDSDSRTMYPRQIIDQDDDWDSNPATRDLSDNYRFREQRGNYQSGPSDGRYYQDGNYQGRWYRDGDFANQPMSEEDQKLADKIRDKLKSWSSKDRNAQFTVFARNGFVIVQGNIDTWDNKKKIVTEILGISDVRDLKPRINVQEPYGMSKDNENKSYGRTNSNENRDQNRSYDRNSNSKNERSYNDRSMEKEERRFPQDQFATPNDRELNKAIREKISEGWLWDSYKDIQLNTENGIVFITGTIKDPKDEQILIEKIQKINGVRSVKSDLATKKQ